MRVFVVSILVVLNVILESTIFQYTRIFGVKPDFTIALIVAYAVMRGASYGAFVGLASGMLIDLLYGKVFGINGLSYMITGYIIGQSHKTVFKDSYIPAILFNAGAVFIYQNLFFLISYFTNGFGDSGISYWYTLVRMIIPQCLYNSVIGGIVYRYLYALDEKKFMNRKIY